MVVKNRYNKLALACTFGLSCLTFVGSIPAQESTDKRVSEPIFRVSKRIGAQEGVGDTVNQKVNEEKTKAVAADPVSESTEARPIEVASLPLPTATKNPVPANLASTVKPEPANPAILSNSANPSVSPPHPLDAAIEIAHTGLEHIQTNIRDYTATMVKRESVNGKVGEQEFIKIKVRNSRETETEKIPFSVYMKFLKPIAGREVIWVEGQNNGNLLVHEVGAMTGFKTFNLEPDGWLAMRGNRHPIYEAGLENLVKKLIDKAERDRAAGECEVEYRKGAKINGRTCTMIEVTHPIRNEPYEFYRAQVFIDDEMQIPVRYAAFDWPTAPGKEPMLLEEYTYIKVELNVGLTNADFDPANDDYNFPGY